MNGLMMDMPLNIAALLQHAARWHRDAAIESRLTEGGFHSTNWGEVEQRSRQLAKALLALGVNQSDRVATLAWNNHRHLELYYAISGIGAICHTINPRLFPEQIAFIVDHAEDKMIFVDLTFLPLVEKLYGHFKCRPRIVVMTDRAHMPETSLDVLCYEELLATQDGDYAWPELDERLASSLCYTSGTTGDPKGVLYSHRSTVLHALATCVPDVLGLKATDTLCPVVPMFHVNAWGIPYAAPIVGNRLAMPGPGLDGKSLYEFFEQTGTTASSGVPTIWFGLLNHVREHGLKFSSLKTITVGGSAAPASMIREFQEVYGVGVMHAWGMTETSPVGTAGSLKYSQRNLSAEDKLAIQCKQGRPLFGVDFRIAGPDNEALPHDGMSSGNLQIRGHWVTSGYFRKPDDQSVRDGWFTTGDVANFDADGFMQITDRSKDVIKSGGEWISSIELENIAVGHPDVLEAAAIAVKHPKWDERPLLVVIRKPGSDLDRDQMLAWFEGKIAKWWMPDDVVFAEDLPHTATGKLMKLKLRETYADYRLPTE